MDGRGSAEIAAKPCAVELIDFDETYSGTALIITEIETATLLLLFPYLIDIEVRIVQVRRVISLFQRCVKIDTGCKRCCNF